MTGPRERAASAHFCEGGGGVVPNNHGGLKQSFVFVVNALIIIIIQGESNRMFHIIFLIKTLAMIFLLICTVLFGY